MSPQSGRGVRAILEQQMYCSSAVMTLITSVEPPVNEQDSFQTEAAVGNILRRRGVRGQEA